MPTPVNCLPVDLLVEGLRFRRERALLLQAEAAKMGRRYILGGCAACSPRHGRSRLRRAGLICDRARQRAQLGRTVTEGNSEKILDRYSKCGSPLGSHKFIAQN